MLHRNILFCTLFTASVAAVACGSSSTAGTGASSSSTGHPSTSSSSGSAGTGGSTGTHSTSSGSGTSTSGSASTSGSSGSSSGAGGSASCADAGTCNATCECENPAASKKFFGYELAACGCAADAGVTASPCAAQCASECTDPSTLTTTSPCGTCLLTQAGMGTSSACSLTAAGNCETDTACSAFINCALACPGN